jgi:hypothetical protein
MTAMTGHAVHGASRSLFMRHDEERTHHAENPLQRTGSSGTWHPRVERRRPAWVVAALIWSSFGLYLIVWIGLNWAELKRERRDENMYPVWHALAMIVPIYSYFRFHANFRVINGLLSETRSDHRARPIIAVFTFILASGLMTVPIETIELMTANLVAALGAISWVAYHGQSSMNAYWDAKPDRTVSVEVKLWERMLIGFGAGLWFLMIMGLLTGINQ